MQQEPYTLAYILGSGRNGSTLLDLMLAGHPSILAMGEIATINGAYDPFEPPEDDHVARRRADRYQRFWAEVKDAYETATGRSFKDLDITHPRLRHALRTSRTDADPWVQDNLALLRALHARSGRPMLLDASKVPQRLLLLQSSGLVRIKVIHLVRDGRAVSCSYLRRYGTFYGGIRTWTHAEVSSLYLRRRFTAEDWMELAYEDLTADPRATLQKICTFLDVAYEERLPRFRRHEYFGIGGNPKVKSSRSSAVSRDDSWRNGVNMTRRIVFGVTAGWLNRINGYPAFAWERRRRPTSTPSGG